MSRIVRSTDVQSALRSRQRGFLLNPFRFGSSSPVFPTSGLLAYYKLDSNASDFSGNGNNGTATSVSFVSGKISNAASFTSSTPSRIDIPSGAKPSANYTFVAWLKPSSLNTVSGLNVIWQDLTPSQRNFRLGLVGTTGRVELVNGNGGSSSVTIGIDAALNTSNFVFLVATRNLTTYKIFVNSSTPSVTSTGAYSGGVTTNQSKIGADPANTTNLGFGGLIDEAGIWNRELTASEIDNLYNSGAGLTYP